MEKRIARCSYWLGIASLVIAVIWRFVNFFLDLQSSAGTAGSAGHVACRMERRARLFSLAWDLLRPVLPRDACKPTPEFSQPSDGEATLFLCLKILST